ncbi:MAG TPA: class I SAM-dependent methyltransferase [Gemmatimonadaceae bacterium]|nr:class I SAM-dependent methyltransferase [Gemmatimonadaceae bacterium]
MNPGSFKDHFSKVARAYAAVRPQYPDELYAFLASRAPARDLAWDSATGNGQAAVGVARHVDHVIATDASAEQIAHAMADPRVEYRVARAEQSGLSDASIDLITVAQAAHWFDLDAFYAEVRRVARPNALIALWAYGYFMIDPEIDAIIDRFGEGKLRSYWPTESRVIRDHYRPLPFPFAEIGAPSFYTQHPFTLDHLEQYFRSWSGVQRYLDSQGEDPIPAVMDEVRGAWGDAHGARTASFELYLRVGHVSPI